MLPSGIVVVDGESLDAVSEGMAIDPGQAVRVTAVRTNRIVVRLEEDLPGPAPAAGDVLSQPAATIGLNILDDAR
jgi:hypothetical protein